MTAGRAREKASGIRANNPITSFISVAAVVFLVTVSLPAAEYFVNKAGNDANSGQSRDAAFLTIQRGVQALQPGSTLTIGPGEYFENVRRDGLGIPDRDTLIRAEIAGTVLLRGSVAVSGFRKVEGRRFVYVVDFDRPVQAVNEGDTLNILETMPNAAELEFMPGTCHYDREQRKLYISTSDLQPPDRHHYTVSVTGEYGLLLNKPERVIVDGLAVTGFNVSAQLPSFPGFRTAWGLMIADGRQCVIRNCTAFLNGGGIGLNSREGGGNIIEHCTAFGNYSRFCGEGGNIVGFSPNNDTIRDCYAHSTRTQGFRLYGDIRGPAIMRNNVSWGNGYGDMWVKGGLAEQFGLAENCITLGRLNVRNLQNCIVGLSNSYRQAGETSRDTILLAAERVAVDRDFADPEHFDFRLQSTSGFRGAGPNGADRGPFPYRADVFYVKPNGDDQADGLSMTNAWRSLPQALKRVRPGDTLYLDEGEYEGGMKFTVGPGGAASTAIRARGAGRVVVRGRLSVAESSNVQFERLNFVDTVEVTGGHAIAFRNCSFAAGSTALRAQATTGLNVTHCIFTGFSEAALRMSASTGAFVSGNLFDNPESTAVQIDRPESIAYSDYNSFRNANRAWQLNDAALALGRIPGQQEQYSRVLTPEFSREGGVPELRNAERFEFGGPVGRSIGVHREARTNLLRMEGPYVHSVSATTANIEWWTSRPATCEIAWGDTPECANRMQFEVYHLGSYSLRGLKPGRRYYFKLNSIGSPPVLVEGENARPMKPNLEVISFITASEPHPPATYYVAPDGNDAHSGQDRKNAWRTISHAAQTVNAGDTVLIAGGRYQETVRIRATGDAGTPITFRGLPRERAIIDGADRSLGCGFNIAGKSHLQFDGIYMAHLSGSSVNSAPWMPWKDGGFRIYQSDHVTITRSMIDGRGLGYSPHFITAWKASHLLVKNCVFTAGFNGSMFRQCPDVVIENSVFWRNLIRAAIINNAPNERFTLRNCIVSDSIPKKVGVQLFEISSLASFAERDNCYYLRVPDAERVPFHFGSAVGKLSLAAYQAKVGPTGSLVTDPKVRRLIGVSAPSGDGATASYVGDQLLDRRPDLDFQDFFSTDPELLRRKIGLEPEAFRGFLVAFPSSSD